MPKLIGDVVDPGTISCTAQPIIGVDGELELRPFRADDVEIVVAAFATPDIQYFHFRQLDHGEALRWIEQCEEGWGSERSATWAIVERSGNRVLGRVSVYLQLAEGQGEISYWVLPDGRGRGCATRACVAATRWAHAIGLHRIELQHSTTNDGSRRVATRAGFLPEGVRREAQRLADGWHDMELHAHLSTDE